MVLITTAFAKMAYLERAALGNAGLELMVMEHPLLGRDMAKLEELADNFMPLFEDRFGGSSS